MFNYSKVALGIAACFALSGCIEVEDNNNNDALVSQLEQQNQILQNQLDYSKQQAEAWKTAITLVGSVELATEGDVLADDVTVTFYYNGQWHDAIAVDENGDFEVPELPSGTRFIAKVSSASNAIVTRNFFFNTPYKSDKFVENLEAFEVGQPKTIEFTVLDEKTNLPFADLHLEALLNSRNYSNGLNHIVADNVSKATLNSETGMYELVVPKGISSPLIQDQDLDNDGTNDVGSLGALSTSLLETNQLFYLGVQKAEEFKLEVTFINTNGEAIKPEYVFATNNDFGTSDFTYNEELKTHSIDANYFGSLSIHIPEFSVNDIFYESKHFAISNYDEQTDSYRVDTDWNRYAVKDNLLSVVVVLNENPEKHLQLQVVTRTETLNQDQGFSYFFNAPVAVNDETVVAIQKLNALTVTAGNASGSDEIEPGTTHFEYSDVEIESTKTLSFNDTALTLKPSAKLEEGYRYRFNIEQIVNQKSEELETVNYSNTVTIENTEAFTDNAFVADNFNYRKAGKLIISKNSAGEAAGSSGNNGEACILIPAKFGIQLNNITIKKAIVNGTEVQINDSWSNSSNTEHLYQLADNENISGQSWDLQTSSAQTNGRYSKKCLRIRDTNWNYIYFEDHTEANENSVTVDINYSMKVDGNWEAKTVEKKLYID